jgi:hypothetical protein
MRIAALAALLCGLPAFAGESGGEATVTLQGYYLGGNSETPERLSGAALAFRDFVPGLGMLSGNLEGYGNGQFEPGDNFVELQGLPWLGRRWTFSGGDFDTPSMLVAFPFTNVFNPDITARGVSAETTHGATRYAFFYGRETLEEGPRVPFRIDAPQTILGASAQYKLHRLEAAARYLHFSSSLEEMLQNQLLFPAGRDFGRVDTVTADLLYKLTGNLQFFGETTASAASQPLAPEAAPNEPVSLLTGAAWEKSKLTFRVNYARQGVLYLPLAGYYAGDRQGPFAELQYRPWKAIELAGSASHYRNNLERNPDVPTFESTSTSLGATARLPWTWTGSAQLSTIQFSTQGDGQAPANSINRHLSAGLSRPFGRHTVRFAYHDLELMANSLPERQRWAEAEDTFHVKRLVLGATVRMQQSIDDERRNTAYVRGLAQFNTRHISVYANVEVGDDLLNRTIFAANTYRTTVVGVTSHLPHKWDLQVEAFRNIQDTLLNPENIFLLEGNGVPLANALSSFNQWNVLVRLRRELHWGAALPSTGIDSFVNSRVPLTGMVEGFVFEQRMSGQHAAAGIPVSLDEDRTATTDQDGCFRFSDVPEGEHHVRLSRTELPADYDPGSTDTAPIAVQPRRTTRATLAVVRLTSISGVLTGPEKAPLAHILVRLLPTKRYTLINESGQFAFHNLREGDYVVVLDEKTLPEGAVLTGAPGIPAPVRLDEAPSEIRFTFVIPDRPKPVRKVEVP